MLNLQSLQNAQRGSAATVAKMRALLDGLNAQIERFESDKTRSREFILEQIKSARGEVLPKLGVLLNALRETAKTIAPDREFWQDKALLLSLQTFDSDPAKDSVIRAERQATFRAMPLPLLQLRARNAVVAGDIAEAWEAAAAAAERNVHTDLSAVIVPDQAAALAAIQFVTEASLAEAELIAAGVAGQTVDPVRRMTLARAMAPSPKALAA